MTAPPPRRASIPITIPRDSELRSETSGGWTADPFVARRWSTTRYHFVLVRSQTTSGDILWGQPVQELSVLAGAVSLEETEEETLSVTMQVADESVYELVRTDEYVRKVLASLSADALLSSGKVASRVDLEAARKQVNQQRQEEIRRASTAVSYTERWQRKLSVAASGSRVFLVPCFQRVVYDVHLEFSDFMTVEYVRRSPMALRARKVKSPPGPTSGSGHWTETNPNITRAHMKIAEIAAWSWMYRSIAVAPEGDKRIGAVRDPSELVVRAVPPTPLLGRCATEDVLSLYELTEGGNWPPKQPL